MLSIQGLTGEVILPDSPSYDISRQNYNGRFNKYPIFVNIEQFFEIDKEWIQGWTEGILQAGYRSGFYNDPVTGYFNHAFCQAAKDNKAILNQNILWSAEPELELENLSRPLNRPLRYEPYSPDCGGNVWIWQYSRDVPQCPIDMNLAHYDLVNLLW
jgi:hypothetical protein